MTRGKIGRANHDRERSTGYNMGLAKVAVQCSADTFVVKIATFAKPETVPTTIHSHPPPHSRGRVRDSSGKPGGPEA